MLDRRGFLTIAGAAGAATFGVTSSNAAEEVVAREYYELIAYEIDTEAQRDGLVAFYNDAAVPALNRMGIKPVGVFLPAEELGPVYVVIPHPNVDSVATLQQRLRADNEYLAKGAAFLNAPAATPAYKRKSSSLLLAFIGMPRLESPAQGADRVFQLRVYESPSAKTGQKKIEMFNTAEIAIFRKVGLTPVFFGEALIGQKMPNLTYMLGFNNPDEQKAAWGAFGKDPDWVKLKSMPEYADKEIISGITNLVLKPAAASQI